MSKNTKKLKSNNQTNDSRNRKIKNKKPINCSYAINIINGELNKYSVDDFRGARILCMDDFISCNNVFSISVIFEDGSIDYYINDIKLCNDLLKNRPERKQISSNEFENIKSEQLSKYDNCMSMFNSAFQHSIDFKLSSITVCNNVSEFDIDYSSYDLIMVAKNNVGITSFLKAFEPYINSTKFLLFVPEVSRVPSLFCKYSSPEEYEMFFGFSRNVDAKKIKYIGTDEKDEDRHMSVITNIDNAQKIINESNGTISTNCSYLLHHDEYRTVPCFKVYDCDGKLHTPIVVGYAYEIPDDYPYPMFMPTTAADNIPTNLYQIYHFNAREYFNSSTNFPWVSKVNDDNMQIRYSNVEIEDGYENGLISIEKSLFYDDAVVECIKETVGKLGSKALVIPTKKCKQACAVNRAGYESSRVDKFIDVSDNDIFNSNEFKKMISNNDYWELSREEAALAVIDSLYRNTLRKKKLSKNETEDIIELTAHKK